MTTINYVIGDATSPIGTGQKVIAHCCNDLGAWGAGFVLALSRRWPGPEVAYSAWAKRSAPHTLPLGEAQFVQVEADIAVANIIGQRGCGWSGGVPPIRYDAIADGFRRIVDRCVDQPASVHMPRIGCGLAGGEWQHIEYIIKAHLCAWGIPVTVYDLKAA